MRNLNKKTVYPAEQVYRVLGQTSPELNQALTAWASLVEQSMLWVEDWFTPEDWEHLALALKGKKMPTPAEQPAALLSLVESAGPLPPGLRQKVCPLKPVQCWAVWRLCRWHDQHRRRLDLAGQPWWRLAWRQEQALEGKDGD